jgi:glycosyltransferase involved in cell wall biosynthesis
VDVTVIYGSDFSVSGYFDDEFGTRFAWDTDLLDGYASEFLTTVDEGGARTAAGVVPTGLGDHLRRLKPRAVMQTGYGAPFHRRTFMSVANHRILQMMRAETIDHANERDSGKRLLRDTALRLLYSNFSGFLYIGERSKEHYKRLGVRDSQLYFSPYCVDESVFKSSEEDRIRFRDETRQALGIPEEGYMLLFSGKLSEWKAPSLLLDAIEQLPAWERQRTVAVFVGDGKLRESLGRSKVNVRLTGFKNQKELSPYFHAADLLVLPSRSETWGLVVNEALQHGIPCVVSAAVGSAPDLIESGVTGEVFSRGSARELAAGIRKVLAYTDATATRQACRRKVSSYSVAAAAEGIAKAFESL